jgi:hypothetical protein
MATYIIIGGDGKEYGPIPAGEVRQWIAEARLNAQSLMKAESDAEFRPLGKFPEFADAFGNVQSVPPIQPLNAVDGSRAVALQKIKVPATGLKVAAIINLVMSVWSLIRLLFFPPNLHALDAQLQQLNNPQLTDFFQKMEHVINGPLGVANSLLGMVMAGLVYAGASRMQALRGYEFAFTAAVISVLPCLSPCCGYIVGLIFGIWALILLLKPEIKSQFN